MNWHAFEQHVGRFHGFSFRFRTEYDFAMREPVSNSRRYKAKRTNYVALSGQKSIMLKTILHFRPNIQCTLAEAKGKVELFNPSPLSASESKAPEFIDLLHVSFFLRADPSKQTTTNPKIIGNGKRLKKASNSRAMPNIVPVNRPLKRSKP